MPEYIQLQLWEPYEPQVNDYVVWERQNWTGIIKDEGWVYFKADAVEPKRGFNSHSRYITIETSVRDKPKEQIDCKSSLNHTKVHTLLLCYEQHWNDLKFIKRRESPNCEHYSQYDDVH